MANPYFEHAEERCKILIAKAMLDPFDATDRWRQIVERDVEGVPEYVEKPSSQDQAHDTARGVFQFLSENDDFKRAMDLTPEAERQRLTYGVAELIRHSEDAHTKKTLGKAVEARKIMQEVEKHVKATVKEMTRVKGDPEEDDFLGCQEAAHDLAEILIEMHPRIQDSLGIRR